MNHVQQCSVKLNLAGKAMSNKATYSGYKSYYIKDVTGAIHKCTTKAFFVLDLQSDLLGGRALVTANYRVILDKDPKVSGIFSVTNQQLDFHLWIRRKVFSLIQKYVRILSMASATWSLSKADNPRYDTACKGNRGIIKGILRQR